jgi:hypothetical protein
VCVNTQDLALEWAKNDFLDVSEVFRSIAPLVPTLFYAVSIPVAGVLYTMLAHTLTQWENHRTESGMCVHIYMYTPTSISCTYAHPCTFIVTHNTHSFPHSHTTHTLSHTHTQHNQTSLLPSYSKSPAFNSSTPIWDYSTSPSTRKT